MCHLYGWGKERILHGTGQQCGTEHISKEQTQSLLHSTESTTVLWYTEWLGCGSKGDYLPYQNAITSILNESVEVWQDVFSALELVETVDLSDLSGGTYVKLVESNYPSTYELRLKSLEFNRKYKEDIIDMRVQTSAGQLTTHSFTSADDAVVTLDYTNKGKKMQEGHLSVFAHKKPELLLTVSPTPGYYPNVSKLCDELNKKLAAQNISFSVVKSGAGEERVKLDTLPSSHRLALRNGMHYVLGYREDQLKRAPHTAQFAADLGRGSFATFLYCDMLQEIVVGDSMSPLLRTTHLSGAKHGEIVNQVFNPALYMRIAKNYMNTIEIRICTDSGEDFPLNENGKLLLTLHFKQLNHSSKQLLQKPYISSLA